MKIEFTKKRLTNYLKVSNSVLFNHELDIDSEGLDIVDDVLTARIKSWYYEHLSETRVLNYYCDRPKFLDWLFRRKKQVSFNLDIKELLLNPPTSKGTVIIYDVESLNN